MPLLVVAFFYGEAVYVCWWHSDPAISRYLSKLTAPATTTPHDRWLDSPIGLALMAAASGREERAAGWVLDAWPWCPAGHGSRCTKAKRALRRPAAIPLSRFIKSSDADCFLAALLTQFKHTKFPSVHPHFFSSYTQLSPPIGGWAGFRSHKFPSLLLSLFVCRPYYSNLVSRIGPCPSCNLNLETALKFFLLSIEEKKTPLHDFWSTTRPSHFFQKLLLRGR